MSEDFDFAEPDEAPEPANEPDAAPEPDEVDRKVDRSVVRRRVAGVEVDPETKEPLE